MAIAKPAAKSVKTTANSRTKRGHTKSGRLLGHASCIVPPPLLTMTGGCSRKMVPTVKSKSALSGRLENVVYFGTDTHYHLRLEGGEAFIVRQQNSCDTRPCSTRCP